MKTKSIVLSVLLLPATAALAQTWVVTGGFDYTTGDYGSSSDTDVFTIPVSLSYEIDRWTYKVMVPYVYISGPADVVSGVGFVGRSGVRSGGGSASGFGDPVFSATYATLQDPEGLNLDLTGKLKLGIADENFSTGESDLMFQADVYQSFGEWTPFGTLGYRFLGDPDAVNLKGGFYLAAGASYRLDEPTRVGAVLDWRESIRDGIDDEVEVSVFINRRINEQWTGQAYVLKGFSDASPDYGLGGSLSYKF